MTAPHTAPDTPGQENHHHPFISEPSPDWSVEWTTVCNMNGFQKPVAQLLPGIPEPFTLGSAHPAVDTHTPAGHPRPARKGPMSV